MPHEVTGSPLAAEQAAQGPDSPTPAIQSLTAPTTAPREASETNPNPADAFNTRYRVGTPVIAYPGLRPDDPFVVEALKRRAARGLADSDTSDLYKRLLTRTRTPAWMLGHGEAVVSVDGYAGGIALAHVEPFRATDTGPEAGAARWVPNNPRELCRDFQQKPEPAAYWCATCGWNQAMHDDEARRTAIAEALKCLPETKGTTR